MAKVGSSMLDVADIVDKMMAYKSLPLVRLQTARQVEQVQLSAYGTLQSMFANFQSTLKNLNDTFNAIVYQATSSSNAVATATITDNNVGVGSHTINVTQLATSQAYTSGIQYNSKTNALNINETLTFSNSENPSQNFSLMIDGNDALADIRDNINSSGNSLGVTASIITSTDDNGNVWYNLILNSKTGTANEFTISDDTGNYFEFEQSVAGQDAIFSVDGFSEVESSNTVDDVIDGITFNLTGTGNATITISQNNSTQSTDVSDGINDMITAYNSIITFLDSNQYVAVYDEKNKTYASGLNSSFQFIKTQLQAAMNMPFQGTGDITNLFQAGFTKAPTATLTDQYDPRKKEITSTGSLQLDANIYPDHGTDTTLNWALTNDFQSLQAFFSDPANGLINNVNNVVTNNIIGASGTGLIASTQASLNSTLRNSDTLIRNESERLAQVKDSLIMQYAKLNASLAKYQSMSDYLEKQFSYLDNLMKGDK